jgi:guanosine-3',5'-bis(diphosphate) 3'-pyrophosphohydrolase
MTQELYQKAMKFAGEKHADQKVPGTNANYLLHISNVVMEVILSYHHNPCFELGYAMQVAILHDTLEDTDTTFDELSKEFGIEVAKGVQALTKDSSIQEKDARMADSLKRIKMMSKEVSIVKLADRITNLQKPPSHWADEKISKYAIEAETILENLIGSNEYLAKRLALKIREYQNM